MDMELHAKASAAVKAKWPDLKPRFGAILGSGWAEVVNACKIIEEIPYEAIPGLGKPGVEGHGGRLARVEAGGMEVLIFQGRRHFYEGEGWTPIATPIAILKDLGAEGLILTNAVGGIRTDLTPGTLMLIEDHINMMGTNPLIGPHNPYWGARFPDQSDVYNAKLRGVALAAASKVGEVLARGTYLALSGPTYETPAEIRAYGRLGADVVGMSTVPEAILANSAGMKVLGISCITNLAAGISANPLSHEEVAETAEAAMPRLKTFFTKLWEELGAHS